MFTATMVSCKKWLSIEPKGQKIPSTIEDYRRLLENISFITGNSTRGSIVNETWVSHTSLTAAPNKNNYLWIEEAGARISAVQNDYNYNTLYKAIYHFNLVINDVPKLNLSGEKDVNEAAILVAQARVFRAMFMFHSVNTYAKAYTPATAATDNGVPYIAVADDFETAIKQETVAQIYEHILNDLNAAIPVLKADVLNFMFPTKSAAIALRSRIHLFMHNYDAALADAETVLSAHQFIYDMVKYHRVNIDPNQDGKNIQGNLSAFSGLPMITFNDAKAEMLWGVGGQTNINYAPAFSFTYQLPASDLAGNQWYIRSSNRFEAGDTRFLCNFYRNPTTLRCSYRRNDYGNMGGMGTPEVYLIRAECYARKGDQSNIDKAIKDLDAIRIKRIVAYVYQPWQGRVSTKAQAIDLIRHERDIELMGTDMMYYDMKRFNTEPEFQRTMIKTDDGGVVRTLKPASELWVMPFPKSVTEMNSNIKQNTKI